MLTLQTAATRHQTLPWDPPEQGQQLPGTHSVLWSSGMQQEEEELLWKHKDGQGTVRLRHCRGDSRDTEDSTEGDSQPRGQGCVTYREILQDSCPTAPQALPAGQSCVTHREILQESCPAAAPQALPAGMGGPGSPRALRGTGKAACPEASFTLKNSEALNPHFRLLLPINGIFGSPLGQPLRRTEPLLVPTSLEHREEENRAKNPKKWELN